MLAQLRRHLVQVRLAQRHGPFVLEFRVAHNELKVNHVHNHLLPRRGSQARPRRRLVIHFGVEGGPIRPARQDVATRAQRCARGNVEPHVGGPQLNVKLLVVLLFRPRLDYMFEVLGGAHRASQSQVCAHLPEHVIVHIVRVQAVLVVGIGAGRLRRHEPFHDGRKRLVYGQVLDNGFFGRDSKRHCTVVQGQLRHFGEH